MGTPNPTHRDGTVINSFADWTYEIEVWMVQAGKHRVTSKEADSGSPLRLIWVRCISPEGARFTSIALVADCVTDASSTTAHENWRRIKLQFEDRGISLATPLRNQPEATNRLTLNPHQHDRIANLRPRSQRLGDGDLYLVVLFTSLVVLTAANAAFSISTSTLHPPPSTAKTIAQIKTIRFG